MPPCWMFGCRDGAEAEIQHSVERCRSFSKTAAQGRSLPAVDQQVRNLPDIAVDRNFALLPSLLKAESEALGYGREAFLDLVTKYVVDARQLLAEPSKKTTHIALPLVGFLDLLEEAPHPCERRPRWVCKTAIKDQVSLCHVGVDDLEREILLVLEVMIERALRSSRRVQQRLNTKVVVAVPQKHRQANLDQALLG